MHISAEDLNLMLSGKAKPAEHAAWTDHILDCPTCTQRFKAMNALHRELAPAHTLRIPLRYALGVAAVMAMSIAPYLRQPDQTPVQQLAARPTELAPIQLAEASPAPSRPTKPAAASAAVSRPLRSTVAFDSVELDHAIAEQPPLSVLNQVAQINFKTSVARWGQEANVANLIALTDPH